MRFITRKNPTFTFIGVTTTKSSIMKVFPRWMELLGRQEITIEGVDLKIHDTPEAYRTAVAQIKYDPLSIGALVTTHKVDLYHAAADMFDSIDRFAKITGEVSCISKREGRLEGHAKDPVTAGLSLDAITGSGYFGRTSGEVLIFGAGGSCAATILHLAMKQDPSDRPRRVTVVNRSAGRLQSIEAMMRGLGSDIELKTVENTDPHVNDAIMERLPDRSIVINATGMGKDTPGSPVTGAGLFPYGGIAWEFNYRGELNFLHQALAQAGPRSLRVEDGWLYFIHGWTQVVAQVLHFDLSPDLFAKLEASASAARG